MHVSIDESMNVGICMQEETKIGFKSELNVVINTASFWVIFCAFYVLHAHRKVIYKHSSFGWLGSWLEVALDAFSLHFEVESTSIPVLPK